MDALELLTNRASNPKLREPAPDAETLSLAYAAAMRAPDHGLLRPFRLHVVRGDARHALGELLAECALRQHPQASAEELEKARNKALRAPVILVVSASLVEHAKVPAIEQILSAGTAAYSLLLALQARGYAGIWRTGAPAYDEGVKEAFGLGPQDALVGFLYAGTAAQAAPTLERPKAEDHVFEWTGPLSR